MNIINQIDGLTVDIQQINRDKLHSLCSEYIGNDFDKHRFERKGKTDCLECWNRSAPLELSVVQLMESIMYTRAGKRTGRVEMTKNEQ